MSRKNTCFNDDRMQRFSNAMKNSLPRPNSRTVDIDPDAPIMKPFKGYRPPQPPIEKGE